MTPDPVSSTGLPSRVAAPLAYAGWWVTGLFFWIVERRDSFVRFHAAQASVAFGAAAALVAAVCALAGLALIVSPALFRPLLGIAGLVWGAGVGVWVTAMWQAATGRAWRIPIAADLADRMCEATSSAAASS